MAWGSHQEMNSKIDQYFQDDIFMKYLDEYALYVKKNEHGDILLVCLYLDSLIITYNQMMSKVFNWNIGTFEKDYFWENNYYYFF